ncbi:hypothetical protein [Moritella sp. Urea-trap-13]|uniref:hypothetical protein n=1 Tax=Moritella sp. Urea-trap-13 TaxID=2058327 RepID=UPI000C343CB3|nr:hypothetical protein [Moritella sp. Urea-trap-13]PKH06648.1 hypothetical protein CXF93_12175 [Moritella sp. Urea-trap-13]
MYKIADIEIDMRDSVSSFVADKLEGLVFDITVKETNSRQLDSNIDHVVEQKLSEIASRIFQKKDRLITTNSEKVGELDIAFDANNGHTYFIEIEKSNKKTIWFDYVKLLTLIQEHDDSYGIIICPKNYAHKVGTWDLFKEAKAYKSHLTRVFQSSSLDRVYVIGYTQYAFLDNNWVKFSPETVLRIKTHNI